jgi:UDP-N-acetylglucosamine 2-epimerase (non-hydrolysing)
MKLIAVAGARPNFIKIAPFLKAVQKANFPRLLGIDLLLLHTGQHYDDEMSRNFFRDLEISPPDINLEVGSASHAVQTARIMIEFEKVCLETVPDWIVVFGDVNSTAACALTASKLGIKIAHVEAGLRSFDRTMPEEINRLVTDTLADLHFTSVPEGNTNLFNEGIEKDKIFSVGNIMIDTLVANIEKIDRCGLFSELGLTEQQYIYCTLHRPANVDEQEKLEQTFKTLDLISEKLPVVLPLHPRTKKRLSEFNIRTDQYEKIRAIEPVNYFGSLNLIKNARIVITDSGGIQEETTFFQVPCLTLRPNTERPITCQIGSNKLVSSQNLMIEVNDLLVKPARFGQIPDLWDGRTAERIVETFMEIM